MADSKTEKNAAERDAAERRSDEATGVSRWKKETGDSAKGRKKRKGDRSRKQGRRRRARRHLPKGAGTQILALVAAVALVVGSVAAAWPFGDVLGWGIDFAGGTSYTYVADADADLSAAADVVSERLESMGVSGASVTEDDGTLVIKLPAGSDDADAVEEATAVGELELVLLDSVSDADAIARIQSGGSDVTLEEGTYEPLVESSQITSASAVLTSSTSSTYGLALTFDSDASTAFEEATSELAPVYGQILVVADGTVVASPRVSSAISGGQVSISAGLTQAQASGIAAAVETGPLPCSLTQQTSSSVNAVAGSSQLLQAGVVAAVVAAVLLVVLLVWMRLTGLMAWLGLLALCCYEVGGLALLSRAGVFVPSVTGYAAACVAVLVAFLVSLYYVAGVRSRLRDGARPRKVAWDTLRAQSRELAVVAVVLAAGGLLLYFLYPFAGYATFSPGLTLPVAVAAAALSVVLVTLPAVRLAGLGSMGRHPGAWGVSPKGDKGKAADKGGDKPADDKGDKGKPGDDESDADDEPADDKGGDKPADADDSSVEADTTAEADAPATDGK